MARFHVVVRINPHRIFEWDESESQSAPRDPTPERLLTYLCSESADAEISAFRARYERLAPSRSALWFAVEHPSLVSNIFGPLAEARAAVLLGNHVSCIGLCGLVAEKVAILRHQVKQHLTGVSAIDYAKIRQADRETVLKRIGLEDESARDFQTVRRLRRKYLHHWNEPGELKIDDVVECYEAAVRVVIWGLGITVVGRDLVIDDDFARHLAALGVLRKVEE